MTEALENLPTKNQVKMIEPIQEIKIGNKWKKLHKFVLSYFIDKNYFNDNGSQDSLRQFIKLIEFFKGLNIKFFLNFSKQIFKICLKKIVKLIVKIIVKLIVKLIFVKLIYKN